MRRQDMILRRVATGVAAGLTASFLSKRFQAVWNTVQQEKTGEPAEGGATQPDPSPVKAADRLLRLLGRRPLPEARKGLAGNLVHYATGAGMGVAYTLLSAPFPRIAAARGLAFGVLTDIVLDKALVPALGLALPPWRKPMLRHLYALATHLVFGLTLDVSARTIRKVATAERAGS